MTPSRGILVERSSASTASNTRSRLTRVVVPSGAAMDKLLKVFELEKAVYELRYELNNRPDWVSIPLDGIMQYCGSSNETVTA